MTRIVKPVPTSLRMRLRAASAEAHEALHRHPLFSRLMARNLTHEELLAVNQANLRLFDAIETSRMRLRLFEAATLAPQIKALRHDVQGWAPPDRSVLHLNCAASVLGGLYVAHGSGFGAKIIRKNIATHLVGARARYYNLDGSAAWRSLCAALEGLDAQGVQIAASAAIEAFAILGQTSNGLQGIQA